MPIKHSRVNQALLIQQANRRYSWLAWQVLKKLAGQYGLSKDTLMEYLTSLKHCHSKTTAEYCLRYMGRFSMIATRNQGKKSALYYMTTHGAKLLDSYNKMPPQEPDASLDINPGEEIV